MRLQILKKYDLEKQVSNSIPDNLLRAPSPALLPNLDEQAAELHERVQNIIIGDNNLAARAALEQAEQEGFHAEILTNELQGEAREVGVNWLSICA